MSDLMPLRVAVDDLAGRRPPPDFDDLRSRATRRGRRRIAVVLTAAVLMVTGSALALAGPGDRASSGDDPAAPSSASPTVQESADAPASLESLAAELHGIVTRSPGWAMDDFPGPEYEYAFNGACSDRSPGEWTEKATSGGDGGVFGWDYGTDLGMAQLGFATESQASDAVARFVGILESCSVTAWQTRSIGYPGATMASSSGGAAWIQQIGKDVRILQMATTDGPPPADVQVAVAAWIVDYHAMVEEQFG